MLAQSVQAAGKHQDGGISRANLMFEADHRCEAFSHKSTVRKIILDEDFDRFRIKIE